MPDDDAIEVYNLAGAEAARVSPGAAAAGQPAIPGVRWPDLALDLPNLERIAAGVLDDHIDFAGAAFGEEFDPEDCADRLETAWRTDALQARFAPEGVFVRARFSVRVTLLPEPDADEHEVVPTPSDAEPDPSETLMVAAEICLSFSALRHTRPYLDFMGGEIRRTSDDASRRLDPFAFAIEPAQAVAWGLNGTAAS